MYKIFIFIASIFLLLWCVPKVPSDIYQSSFTGSSDIEYFWFALTDCGTNYTSQVDTFVNLIDICPFDTKNVAQRVEEAAKWENKILLHLGYFFIDIEPTTFSPSGMKYTLKEDFSSLFDEWLQNNQDIDWTKVAAIYLPDEPAHNQMSPADLETIAKYLKKKLPQVPLLVIEAYSATDELELNQYIDWVWFDRYGTIDPLNTPEYLEAYSNIASKMNPNQKHVVVMESQWIPYYSDEWFEESILQEMAKNYYKFAQKEGNTVAIISYLLPDDFDIEGQKGFLSLNPENRKIYEHIGTEIITK